MQPQLRSSAHAPRPATTISALVDQAIEDDVDSKMAVDLNEPRPIA